MAEGVLATKEGGPGRAVAGLDGIARDHVLLLARTSENELPVAEKKNLLSRNSMPTRSAATAPPCAAGDQLDRADDSASMPAPALA